MMASKIFFVGNTLGGDDGIGPFLYNQLKGDPRLKGNDLIDLGISSMDLMSHLEGADNIIIIDALYSDDQAGEVVLIREHELKKGVSLFSQHDLGIEHIIPMARLVMPGLKDINIIGIKVRKISAFSDDLSEEIKKKVHKIKEEVVCLINNVNNASGSR